MDISQQAADYALAQDGARLLVSAARMAADIAYSDAMAFSDHRMAAKLYQEAYSKLCVVERDLAKQLIAHEVEVAKDPLLEHGVPFESDRHYVERDKYETLLTGMPSKLPRMYIFREKALADQERIVASRSEKS